MIGKATVKRIAHTKIKPPFSDRVCGSTEGPITIGSTGIRNQTTPKAAVSTTANAPLRPGGELTILPDYQTTQEVREH